MGAVVLVLYRKNMLQNDDDVKLPGRAFPSLSAFRQERPNATRPSESVVTLAPSRVL